MKTTLTDEQIATYKEIALRIAFDIGLNDTDSTLKEASLIYDWLIKDDILLNEVHSN